MSYCPIEDKFMNDVWDALKADASDLRKQQRILRAYRAAHPREMADDNDLEKDMLDQMLLGMFDDG